MWFMISRRILCVPAPIGPGATFTFDWTDVTNLKVRLSSGNRDHSVGWIVLRATDSPLQELSWGGEKAKIGHGLEHGLGKIEFQARRVPC
jgi:hypothetical protein